MQLERQGLPQVTESMLTIAAVNGKMEVMASLLRQKSKDFHVAEDALKAASVDPFESCRIMQLFVTHKSVEPKVIETFVALCKGCLSRIILG